MESSSNRNSPGADLRSVRVFDDIQRHEPHNARLRDRLNVARQLQCNNQEDFVDIYFSVGGTVFSKVGTVASDVVSFVHNAAGVGAGVQLCYQVQTGNNAGLSPFSSIACATTPAIVFVAAPNAPANLVVQ